MNKGETIKFVFASKFNIDYGRGRGGEREHKSHPRRGMKDFFFVCQQYFAINLNVHLYTSTYLSAIKIRKLPL
jgi:hypothetical protein